jgi:hypothetical protein
MLIPEYIETRINRAAPKDGCVVPGSSPVISFGDASKARVATLGLNPSRREFDPGRHLAKTDGSVEQIMKACNDYFFGTPYWEWFARFASILRAFNASYCNSSACHLDLVQWATNPTWSHLETSVKKRLIEDGMPFLEDQVRNNENIEILLVNGSGVLNQLQRSGSLDDVQPVGSIDRHPYPATKLFAGRFLDRVKVLAWSTNLQGAHGVSKTLWEKELPGHLKAIP